MANILKELCATESIENKRVCFANSDKHSRIVMVPWVCRDECCIIIRSSDRKYSSLVFSTHEVRERERDLRAICFEQI